ncbi:glutaminase A [Ilyobacter sp.]|uniref:glutaminase A n=1 Tax=Ilyobacter sp. TaxID=3100343 RepID=UPI0035617DEB
MFGENILHDLILKNKKKCQMGTVANYIPGLDRAEKEDLGVCIIKSDNQIFASGNYKQKFTIQSISKPLVLLLAIIDNGEDYVFSKIGMEPTGDAFNSIKKLETCIHHKPFNPMINAGAIAVSSMIKGNNSDEKFERIIKFIEKISENPELEYDHEIYSGEKRTGNRNRSMAYFMKNDNIIEGEVEEALDVYFKQCSILITAMDLARIGLFLSKDGVLSTGERVISERAAKIAKSLMITCGMYDGSGEFAVKVGFPSKSGVGGGILSSVPGKMGIGVYGPALDQKGNSIGGYAILEDISKLMSLSIF